MGIHLAAIYGNLKVIELFDSKEFDLKVKGENSMNILHLAC